MGHLLDDLEKTAAPMFGKKRYKPRKLDHTRVRLDNAMEEEEFRRDSNDPNFSETALEGRKKELAALSPIVDKENSRFARIGLSGIISADMLRRSGKVLVGPSSPNQMKKAKRYGVAAGVAAAYPTASILGESLKNRYKYSKQENIDKDMAEKKIDQMVADRRDNYLKSKGSDPEAYNSIRNNISSRKLQSLTAEAKSKGSRLRFNEDLSVSFVNKKGKERKKVFPLNEYGESYDD